MVKASENVGTVISEMTTCPGDWTVTLEEVLFGFLTRLTTGLA